MGIASDVIHKSLLITCVLGALSCGETSQKRTPTATPDFFSEMVRVSEGYEARVLETLEVGQYSYCRVRPLGDSEERWIVALQSAPSKARIQVRTFGKLSPFYSKRLGRTFQTLDFAVISAASTGKKK